MQKHHSPQSGSSHSTYWECTRHKTSGTEKETHIGKKPQTIFLQNVLLVNVLNFVDPTLAKGQSGNGNMRKIPTNATASYAKNPMALTTGWFIVFPNPESRLALLKTEGFHANPEISKGWGKPKGSELVDTSYIWNPILHAERTNPQKKGSRLCQPIN